MPPPIHRGERRRRAGLYLGQEGHGTSGAGKAGTSGRKNAFGLTLPADAAPASEQFLVGYYDSVGQTYKAMDFYETVYSRAPLADNFNHTLVRITSDYKIVPGTATHWAQTSPTTWEFNIKPGIMWSDGNELTANDYVETLRYSADPKHAWDFTWYWSGVIKNYTEAVAGKAPVNSIGVSVGSNKYTFVVTTEGPVALHPQAMLYSQVLSAAGPRQVRQRAVQHQPGHRYHLRALHLEDVQPDGRGRAGAEHEVHGALQADHPVPGGQDLCRHRAAAAVRDRRDRLRRAPLTKTDLAIVKSTRASTSCRLYLNPQDFRVYYVFFKTKAAPFNNVKVRQAFAHAVNRTADHQRSAGPAGHPGLRLPDGRVPLRHQPAAREVHQLRPRAGAKAHGRSGVPERQGLPEGDLQLPGRQRLARQHQRGTGRAGPVGQLRAGPVRGHQHAAALRDGRSTFYSKMEALPTQVEMGFVSYGMDYFDASNMLGVYKGGGRHDWDNAQYDNLLAQGAAAFNTAKRQEIYTQAQILLTSQAPGVFVFHGLDAYLMQPYLQGPALAKNYLGYTGLQWPGFATDSTNLQGLYVANNVGKYPPRQLKAAYCKRRSSGRAGHRALRAERTPPARPGQTQTGQTQTRVEPSCRGTCTVVNPEPMA